jgi:hypothetical protein
MNYPVELAEEIKRRWLLERAKNEKLRAAIEKHRRDVRRLDPESEGSVDQELYAALDE